MSEDQDVATAQPAAEMIPPAALLENNKLATGNGKKKRKGPDEYDHTKPIRDPSISKNEQKRRLKAAKWDAEKEARKAVRRVKTKEKRKYDKAIKRAEREADAQTQAEAEAQDGEPSSKRQKPEPDYPKKFNIRCILDCAFDEYMTDKEVISLGSQVTRSYAENRKAKTRVNLELTSINKRLQERLTIMHGDQYKNWRKGVKVAEEDYVLKEGEEMIYLSSDSSETLEELEEGKAYVVGGIVDKNRHKGLCLNKATEQGLRTAKLPIGDYIKMTSRTVLTTNQVVEIMLQWVECRDWKTAFMNVIPMRKQKTALTGSLGSVGGKDIESPQTDNEDDLDNEVEGSLTEQTLADIEKPVPAEATPPSTERAL